MKNLSERQKSLIRLALFALPLLNAILVQFGISPLPLGEADLEMALTLFATAITGAIVWWKDNKMSDRALLRDKATKNKSKEELEELARK